MKMEAYALTERQEIDLLRGVLISKMHRHIGYHLWGQRFDLDWLRQMLACKDNAARRLLLGITGDKRTPRPVRIKRAA